jgi:hypothetical protein
MMLRRLLLLTVLTVSVAACDQRLNPVQVGVRPPPVTAPTGAFDLVAVNDTPMPHITSQGNVNYVVVSGTFNLNNDSTWLLSTVDQQSDKNTGVVYGTSPANYIGTWSVKDSTINMSPDRGSMKMKGDSLFWAGAPKRSWEDTLRFTLVRKK